MRGALSALDTGAFAQRRVRGAGDFSVYAAPQKFKRPDILHILADFYTPAAADTFFRAKDNRGVGIVNGKIVGDFLIRRFPYSEFRSQILKFAGLVARTLEAVVGVV